ncbi:MAG: glycogen debranching protein GlgX [Aggregatilineales bacterium]
MSQQYEIFPGDPLPFGASLRDDRINFSIYSRHATDCTLVLFYEGEITPFAEISIPDTYRIGDVFAVSIKGLDPKRVEYGYRLDGPNAPEDGKIFDPSVILLDPYSKVIGGQLIWGTQFAVDNPFHHRARIIEETFDWGEDRPLRTPIEDLIIYEMHVRGFTKHASSGATNPGSYQAIQEKIPYLKELGINCVELMPIFEFNEFENYRYCPDTEELLLNYWGYAPIAFFAPKAGYAASNRPGGEINELKALIKALHANGIEVILDVVFNHTAEGNEKGPTISFKGIDNSIYYILTPDGYYYNFSGTGNTFNCNHPRVRHLILDCLRYWVSEYHIDGFRFDLASVMTRDVNGMPLHDPPLLREIVDDPVLTGTKLIAEPWDADGLYHLGSFPAYGRWAEWNGEYRDTVRKFLKGDPGQVRAISQALIASPHLYPRRGPIATINFVTAHDGFTLMDLVSYNEKHNEANCEPGDSGTNDNHSWNCGVEGATEDPKVNELRHRQVKNALAILLMSQGVPMVLMGDEMGRTQQGNNNAYCQDTPISWLDWSFIQKNWNIFEFFKACIAFRQRHPVLRNGYFLRGHDYAKKGYPDITWHGYKVGKPNFSSDSHSLAFMLYGDYAKGGLAQDNHIYMAMNMHWKRHRFELPTLPEKQAWHLFVNTGKPNEFFHLPDTEPRLEKQTSISLSPRSIVILVGHK